MAALASAAAASAAAGTRTHWVDPELIWLTDNNINVAFSRDGGDSVTDGIVEVEVGKLGLGEKCCHLGVVVRANADVESKTVSERKGEGLRAECEVVR